MANAVDGTAVAGGEGFSRHDTFTFSGEHTVEYFEGYIDHIIFQSPATGYTVMTGVMEGKTYTQVIEQTNISSATLSRVSRCVQYGEGYSQLLAPDSRG